MTDQVTRVALAVDSSQVTAGKTALDGFAAAGAKAEKQVDNLATSSRNAAAGINAAVSATSGAAAAAAKLSSAQAGAAKALRDSGGSAKQAAGAWVDVQKAQEQAAAAAARNQQAQAALTAATSRLAGAQAALAKAGDSGPPTQERLAAATQRIESAQAGLAVATARAASAQTAATAAATRHQQALASLGRQSGLTANQAQQLGFQLNDFFVQIASGGNPLTAFIQQGSQLSGTFGGARNALSAVLSLLTPLRLGLLGVGAAVGVFALAAKQSEDFARALGTVQAALAGTGRGGSFSNSEISRLIEQIAQAPGVTREAATQTVTELARISQVSGDLFTGLGKLAADYARVTGKEVPAAAKELGQAFADPEQGARTLERALGTLSSSTLLTVQRLSDQGNVLGAQRVLYDELKQKIGGLASEGVTPLQTATNDLGNAWDRLMGTFRESEGLRQANANLAQMLGYIAKGVEKFPEFEASARRALRFAPIFGSLVGSGNTGGATGSFEAPVDNTNSQSPVVRSAQEATKATEDAIKRSLELGKSYQSTAGKVAELTDKQKALKDALQLAKTTYGENSEQAKRLGQAVAGIGEQIDQLRKKDLTGPLEVQKARLADAIAAIGRELDKLTGAYADAEAVLDATRQAGLVSEKQYFDAKLSFIRLNEQAQVRALEAENERLRQTPVVGRDRFETERNRLEVQRQIADNEARIAILRGQAGARATVLDLQQAEALRKLREQVNETRIAYDLYADAQRRANDVEISIVGRGDRNAQIARARAAVDERFRQAEADLDRRVRANVSPTAAQTKAFDDEREIIRKAKQAELAEVTRANDAMLRAQSDWSNGMTRALENYLDGIRDVATETDRFITGTLRGIEDLFVQGIGKGKFDFKSLFTQIGDEALRATVRQYIVGPMIEEIQGGLASDTGLGGALKAILGPIFGDTSKLGFPGPKQAADAAIAKASASSAFSVNTLGKAADAAAQALARISGGSVVPGASISLPSIPPAVSAEERQSILDLFKTEETTEKTAEANTALGGLSEAIGQSVDAFGVLSAATGNWTTLFSQVINGLISSLSGSGKTFGSGSGGGGLFETFASFFSGFDGGGYTGDGAKLEPAGIVHRGEHVTRAEVVKQPGARAFLDQFNRRGMSALPGYADGGYVGSGSTAVARGGNTYNFRGITVNSNGAMDRAAEERSAQRIARTAARFMSRQSA